MTCDALLTNHDAVEPRLMWALRSGGRRLHVVCCKGCSEQMISIGLHVQPERRSLPDRADRGSFSFGPLIDRLRAAS